MDRFGLTGTTCNRRVQLTPYEDVRLDNTIPVANIRQPRSPGYQQRSRNGLPCEKKNTDDLSSSFNKSQVSNTRAKFLGRPIFGVTSRLAQKSNGGVKALAARIASESLSKDKLKLLGTRRMLQG